MDQLAWDERYRSKDLPWGTEPNGFLVEAVGGLGPGTALDLACGQGRNAVWLSGRGWSVTAVDWSEVGVDQGRQLAESAGVTINWRIADLVGWAPDRTYDLVTVVYLQIPRIEREAVWRAASHGVAKGGRLVVIGHDSDNLVRGYGGPQDPGVLYAPDEVVAVVGDRLHILRSEQVIRRVETDEGEAKAIDNIVVACARVT